jgi:hypothetical protein
MTRASARCVKHGSHSQSGAGTTEHDGQRGSDTHRLRELGVGLLLAVLTRVLIEDRPRWPGRDNGAGGTLLPLHCRCGSADAWLHLHAASSVVLGDLATGQRSRAGGGRAWAAWFLFDLAGRWARCCRLREPARWCGCGSPWRGLELDLSPGSHRCCSWLCLDLSRWAASSGGSQARTSPRGHDPGGGR